MESFALIDPEKGEQKAQSCENDAYTQVPCRSHMSESASGNQAH